LRGFDGLWAAVRLVNTIREFLGFWSVFSGLGVEEKLEGWLGFYMSSYPELLEKQVGCWGGLERLREVLATRMLPALDQKIHDILEAWMQMLYVVGGLEEAAGRIGLGRRPVIVVYYGSGCGAGWATTLLGEPALLLDAGMAAQLGWISEERVKGLVAHELGHLRHMELRGEWMEFEEREGNPYFQLYSEGVAQAYEHIIMGRESWHMAPDDAWLRSCREKMNYLARLYLERAEGGDVGGFYGVWIEEEGVKYAGYFLGHEFVKWVKGMIGESLEEIARLSEAEVESLVKKFLREAGT